MVGSSSTVRLLAVQAVWILLAAILFSRLPLNAQTGATVSGVVQDESSAVIAGAKVTVKNDDTGVARSTTSDAEGRYAVRDLIPGNYEIQVEAQGFSTAVRSGLTLNVQSDISIPLVLKVGQVNQKTEVTAEAPIVETENSTLAGLVDSRTVRDLPLNARSFDELIALESSAPEYRMNSANLATGMSADFSVNGAWITQNLYLMDGVELVGGEISSTAPGGILGIDAGVEAVQEFKVMTGDYSAEFGKRMGGIINIATRSGSNAFHGSMYEFLRNSDLDAKNYFDPGHAGPPAFKRNQYGAALGGRIKKDKAFFFVNYEGLDERQSITDIAFVPDNNARRGYLPCSAAPTFACGAGGLAYVGVNPLVQPYLNLYPVANTPPIGGGTAEYLSTPVEPSLMNSFLGRIDDNLSDKDSLTFRYNFSKATQIQPQAVGYINLNNRSFDQFAVLEWKRIISPNTLNSLRFGFSRGTGFETSALADGKPFNTALDFIPGAPFMGGIQFTTAGGGGGGGGAVTGIGANIVAPARISALNQYEVNDSIYHQVGAHALHFGITEQRIQQNVALPSFTYGNYGFASLANFLQASPSIFLGADPAVGVDGEKGYRHIYIAGFAEDDYKVSHNFTLNLGLRYELMTVPTEVNGLLANYPPSDVNGVIIMASTPTLGKPLYHGSHDDFAPRLGFAWDVFGNGKTSVRGGIGIYFDQIETFYDEQTIVNAPYFDTLAIIHPPFPLGFSNGIGAALPAVDGVQQNLKTPTRLQYSFTVQQQLSRNTALSVGYVGAHSYHLTDVTDGNRAVPEILPDGSPGCTTIPCYYYPPGSLPRNPDLGQAQLVLSDGDETYQALQVNLLRRLSAGLLGKISFTYAKSIDDVSNIDSAQGPGAPISPEISENIGSQRGLSDYDQKFNLVGNFTYELPFKRLFSGAPERLVGGWQLGGILTLGSGFPFSALVGFNQADNDSRNISDRPNLVNSPSCTNPVLGGVNLYFNPTCFTLPSPGFYGDVGRNTLIGPTIRDFDVNLQKTITFNERFRLVLRGEAFNLPNHPNFQLPSNSIFSATDTTPPGEYLPNVGRITGTSTTSRQIQIGAKLVF